MVMFKHLSLDLNKELLTHLITFRQMTIRPKVRIKIITVEKININNKIIKEANTKRLRPRMSSNTKRLRLRMSRIPHQDLIMPSVIIISIFSLI